MAWLEEITDLSPGSGLVFSWFWFNLNNLSPVLILTNGTGVEFGSLIKKHPIKSPKVSVTSLTFVIVAIAPLDFPISFAPIWTYPPNLDIDSSASELVSTFKTVDDAEYTAGKDWFRSYGFALYWLDGLLYAPALWVGFAVLNVIIFWPPIYPSTVSPILNDPETIEISKSLGIISIELISSIKL